MARKKQTLADLSGLDALGLHREQKETGKPPVEKPLEANMAQKETIPEKKEKDVIQISAYVPKELYKRVKVALAGQDKHTLTSLLIHLLNEWEKEQ